MFTPEEVRKTFTNFAPRYDASHACFTLYITHDYEHALSEVQRFPVPGGRFVALEMRLSPHSLPRWLLPLPHICVDDMTQRTLDELKHAFGDIQVPHPIPVGDDLSGLAVNDGS